MDEIKTIYEHCGESKNYFIYEPEENAELMDKLYVHKSTMTGGPTKQIKLIISEVEAD